MKSLNFPVFKHRFKNSENKSYIFDIIRKKFIHLSSEEWVRQNTIHFFVYIKNYPISLINVEKKITVNNISKRFDIIIFNRNGLIEILVECKSSSVSINQKVFDQIALYNMSVNSRFLMLTNGLDHYFCFMNYKLKNYEFLKNIPKCNYK